MRKIKYMTSEELEKQEHLSTQLLHSFIAKNSVITLDLSYKKRPTSNFRELMDWASEVFSHYLSDDFNLNKFVHNHIMIDGQFLQFCQENKIKITTLYTDSIISWASDYKYEKFFVQGVFLIQANGVEFLQATLWHKGNQNEDEVSFFVIVSENNYDGYLKLRNQYDMWSQQRDRSNLFVRVIEGQEIPYTKDCSWDDLFLPQEMKKEIKGVIENFLNSKAFYLEKKIPWKRGILLYGQPGCGKTSIIRTIMSEYDFKPITVAAGANDNMISEAFAYAEAQSPSLLYFEDLDSILDTTASTSSFLNLMDGISTKNGLLVVATANDIRKLKSNITQRPSRFDRKYKIPSPNIEMASIYLKKWFGTMLISAKYKELATCAVKYDFSYAHLKELYISSMFEALSNNRKVPTAKDINNTLDRLIKDKNLLNENSIDTEKYFH